MNNLTTFYVVRHGETEYNTKGIAQGHLDSPLTDKGISEARELGMKFRDINFDLVFSSDLLRAKRTAEIILLEKQLAVQTTELLRERFYGKYEGKPFNAVLTYRKLLRKLRKENQDQKPKSEIEDDDSVIARLFTFLRETAIAYKNKIILIVTHGGIMRQLLEHLGVPTLPYGAVKNLAFVKLESDGVDFFIRETSGIVGAKPCFRP